MKLFIATLLSLMSYIVSAQENKTDWNALSDYKVPEWFKDAKFGIYFHLGVYSVPEFQTEWYPRYLYFPWSDVRKHHEATYGPVSRFGYHDLIPLFKAEKFNVKEWVSLFKEAGARFVGPVAEHHDGFSMWNSECTPWNAVDMGSKRDIVGEIPADQRKVLLEIGEWLKQNGEAIYDTRPWYTYGEGPTKEPEGSVSKQMVKVPEIKRVTILGSNKAVDWKMDGNGLMLNVPEIPNKVSMVYKVEFL